MDYYEQLAVENHHLKQALMEAQQSDKLKNRLIISMAMTLAPKRKSIKLKVVDESEGIVYNAKGTEDEKYIMFQRGTEEEAASWQEN